MIRKGADFLNKLAFPGQLLRHSASVRLCSKLEPAQTLITGAGIDTLTSGLEEA
jgi:hypothetical protein